VEPADGVPQLHPEALVTLGDVRLWGIGMFTVVVTADDAVDPTLLTAATIVPVEEVFQEVGDRETLRSGPLTAETVTPAALLNPFTSLPFDKDAWTLTDETVIEDGRVPLMTMLAKLFPAASEAVCVHVNTSPATGVPHVQPPDEVLLATEGPLSRLGMETTTVVDPTTVEVPDEDTATVRLAEFPAVHTDGELETKRDKSEPFTMTMVAAA
jgi:hypothetical protein